MRKAKKPGPGARIVAETREAQAVSRRLWKGLVAFNIEQAGPLRRDEEIASAAVVGVDTVEFLGLPDGLVTEDLDTRRLLAASIRRHRPEIVICPNFRESWGMPSWNHVDHRKVGVALLDATRDAGNRWIFPELIDEGLEPWSGVRFVAFSGSPQATHL